MPRNCFVAGAAIRDGRRVGSGGGGGAGYRGCGGVVGRVGGRVISARGGGGEMGREVLIARRVIRGGWVYRVPERGAIVEV